MHNEKLLTSPQAEGTTQSLSHTRRPRNKSSAGTKRLAISILLPVLLISGYAWSEIYRWTDENGKVHFSDIPPLNQASQAVELPKISTYESVSVESSARDSGPEVIMYSASWCGVCKKARQYFQKNKIAFKEYDIEKSAKAKAAYRKLNAKGVPVILIGNKRMNGFSARGFNKLYQNL